MFNYHLPDHPKAGAIYFDPINDLWRVYNGKTWVDVSLQQHKCNLNEESIQDKKDLP